MSNVALGQRALIVELRSRGLSPTQIFRQYGISLSQTRKWWRRHQSGQGLDDLPRSGRPEKLPKTAEKKLRALLKRKKGGSSRRVAADFYAATGHRLHHTTVSRIGADLGLRYRIRPKKPKLLERHKQARLAFAQQQHSANFWRHVVSTDEKTFTLHFEARGQWCEIGEEPEPRGTVKYDVGVRVWGGVCYDGLTPLYRIPKSMTGQQFQQFLQNIVYPDLRRKFGGNFVFQQDGDGSHTAGLVVNWLDEQPEGWIRDWPARSPDLSPVENLWAILLQRLEGKKVKTADGLWRALKTEWENLPRSVWRKLGGSWQKRMDLVVAAHGGAIKY